jgi:hypothetical protein
MTMWNSQILKCHFHAVTRDIKDILVTSTQLSNLLACIYGTWYKVEDLGFTQMSYK